jgi:hypothetical protein
MSTPGKLEKYAWPPEYITPTQKKSNSNNVLLPMQVLKNTKRHVYSTVLFNFVLRQNKILQVQD